MNRTCYNYHPYIIHKIYSQKIGKQLPQEVLVRVRTVHLNLLLMFLDEPEMMTAMGYFTELVLYQTSQKTLKTGFDSEKPYIS